MKTNEPTRPDTGADKSRPDTTGAERASADVARGNFARLAVAQRARPRFEKLLGGAVCLVALAAGVGLGLLVRWASADAAALAPRRATVAAFSAAEKDHLRRQYNRFTQLSAEQQDHLRDLDSELAAADDAEALRGTLRRYHDWLRTLSPSQRSELLKLAAGQAERRAERVEELSPLSRPDVMAVEKWLKACAKARMPKTMVGNASENTLLYWGQGLLYEPLFGGREPARPAIKVFGPPRPLEESDFAKLSVDLSDLRRNELDREKGMTEKRRLVWSWWQRRRTPGDMRYGPASADELVRFYTEDLNDEARDKLKALPPEQRNRELRDEYRKAKAAEGFKRPPQPGEGT